MIDSENLSQDSDSYSPSRPVDALDLLDNFHQDVPASSQTVSFTRKVQPALIVPKLDLPELAASEYMSIHQWFEAQVEQTPDAIAVSSQGQTLTYQVLNQRANQLAHHLKTLGVQPEELVAISMHRCPEMVICFLGVLKAGAAYVPIDPTYPHERRAYKLKDAQVRFILTQQHLVESLPDHSACVICPDTEWSAIAHHSSENLPMLTRPQDLAYVIYTSGSTGNPKGVMITHQGMMHHTRAIVQAFDLQVGDLVLQFSSMSFDIIVEEVYPSLVRGATLVLRTEASINSTRNFLEFIAQEQITVLNLPTAFWHGLVSGLTLLNVSLPPAVRLLIVGGEKASSSIYAEWQKLVGPYPRWLNAYGPTETTVTATIFDPIAAGYDPSQAEIPIGYPLPNSQIYILDENLQPVPEGEIGEMYIGGPGLARGYLNLAERTASKFIANPLSDQPESRLYRTGDTARYLADGSLEFIGRIDFQVKIRGFRIELAEIETYLEQYPAVQQSIVLAREDVPGEKRLAAYIIPKPGQQPNRSELRAFLQTKLPEYMIPAAVIVLEIFPMLPNGKVDRRAFPEPQVTDLVQARELVLPSSALEAQLVKIWEQVLSIKPISTTDNFMDLGGTSLLVARLADQIDQQLNQTLSLAVIFQAPTIKQLAQVLQQQDAINQNPSLVAIQPQGSRPPLFLFEGASIYHPLIPYLGLDQPIYGLIAMVKDGINGPINQVEEIAAHYIQEMVKIQPEGPYYLGGLSFGGIIAFEVAQQLATQGQKTEVLALFDTILPSAVSPLDPYERLQFHSKKIAQHGVSYLVHRVTDKVQKAVGQLRLRYPNAPQNAEQSKLQPQPGSKTADYFMLRAIDDRAEAAYRLKPYGGEVVVFRALNDPDMEGAKVDADLGWTPYSTGLKIYGVPGDHLSILKEPNISILGDQLKQLLDQP